AARREAPAGAVRGLSGVSAPAGWDEAAARSPWGHALQSSAWAQIRAAQGWRPEFVRIADPLPVALVLWRDALPRRTIATAWRPRSRGWRRSRASGARCS